MHGRAACQHTQPENHTQYNSDDPGHGSKDQVDQWKPQAIHPHDVIVGWRQRPPWQVTGLDEIQDRGDSFGYECCFDYRDLKKATQR